MQTIQVGTLKTKFSEVLNSIKNNGDIFVIEYGKKRHKIAMIIPYDEAYEEQSERKFGILKNKASFVINDDFAMTDEELLET